MDSEHTLPYDTVIEIYDDEQIYNVLAITEFKPQNAVYIGTRKLKSKRVKNSIITCLRSLGLNTKCFFYSTDMLSLESVIAELTHILSLFDNCLIDLTGGSEVALVAVGMLAREKNIPLLRYDRYERCYRDIYNCPIAEDVKSDPHFNVPSLLALAGGVMKEHGHVSLDTLDNETETDIFRVWEIFKRRHRTWHRLVAFLQQAVKRQSDAGGDELDHISVPSVIYSGDKLVNCDIQLMRELAGAGIIQDFTEKGGTLGFRFKSHLMRSCLIDTGICLELYVFAETLRSGCYDDVKLSVVVDWDGDLSQRINTINEIDVMLTRCQIPVFISCKSGTPNVVALNEIKTLAKQFGQTNGRPVLVTIADVRGRDEYLTQRAEDMGITIIDRGDLVNDRLNKRLLAASKL